MQLNKKAQFGPDFLVAIVLVLLIGLGGVLFLNLFVGGVTMQGLLSILDLEYEQRCYGILTTLVADEYVMLGAPVDGRLYFSELQDTYLMGETTTIRSARFDERMSSFKTAVLQGSYRIKNIYYFLSPRDKVGYWNQQITAEMESRGEDWTTFEICSMPVFGPYEVGIAQLYIQIDEN